MTGFAPLVTARLLLRPLRASDAPDVHRLVNDWDIAKNLAHVPFPYPRDLADSWIADTAERLAAGRAYSLAVERDGVLVGCAGLTLDGEEADLGYWIGRRYWGQGIAAEAAGRLSAWALATLPLRRIRAQALLDNARSIAVLTRVGFSPDGEGEADFVSRGGMMPVVKFVATRDSLPSLTPALAAAPAAASPRILLVAACALIDSGGRVLLARRPEGKPLAGLWEFPGGKVDAGETPEDALIRELHEELGIEVNSACLAPFTFASHAFPDFHLLMPLYLCRRWQGQVTGREGQALAWVRPQKLGDYQMPPADVPLVALLRDFL